METKVLKKIFGQLEFELNKFENDEEDFEEDLQKIDHCSLANFQLYLLRRGATERGKVWARFRDAISQTSLMFSYSNKATRSVILKDLNFSDFLRYESENLAIEYCRIFCKTGDRYCLEQILSILVLCRPKNIRYDLCQWIEDVVDSLDDVNKGLKCVLLDFLGKYSEDELESVRLYVGDFSS